MKIISAHYEHSAIGFPHIQLKWFVSDGKIETAYITIKGIMSGEWVFANEWPLPFMRYELERFDAWVRQNYANDASVQG